MNDFPFEREVRALTREDRPEDTVRLADLVGQRIARQVTTSQIRNVYGTVREIQTSWRAEAENAAAYRNAVLLKPKITYAAARERGQGMKDLEAVLTPALDEMMQGADMQQKHERFIRFADFFEAILAYHKKYGGN